MKELQSLANCCGVDIKRKAPPDMENNRLQNMENNPLESGNSNSVSRSSKENDAFVFHDLWNKNRSWTCFSGCATPVTLHVSFWLTSFLKLCLTLCTNMNSNITVKDIVLAGLSFPVIVAILLPQSGILYRQTHSVSSSTHALPVVRNPSV